MLSEKNFFPVHTNVEEDEEPDTACAPLEVRVDGHKRGEKGKHAMPIGWTRGIFTQRASTFRFIAASQGLHTDVHKTCKFLV